MKEIVSFYLSGKMYGVDVDHMQGIEKHRELARPTGLPDFMEGVADIRGELIPVMALKKRLILPPADVTEKTKLLVFRTRNGKLACIVDGIYRILQIDNDNAQEFPRIIQSEETGYADFVARIGSELILVINPENLINEAEWVSVGEILDRMEEEDDD